jgi:hypothetical protein
MNCKDFETMVHEIVSGRAVDKTKQLEALEHAGHCLWCALRFDEETKLTESLRGLARTLNPQRAPARVEEALVEAFRERPRRATAPLFGLAGKRLWRWLGWGLAFAATVAAAWIVILQAPHLRRGPSVPSRQVASNRPLTSPPPTQAKGELGSAPAQSQGQAKAQEVATDFIPLGTCDDSDCMDEAMLVRVSLPAEALLTFGLPINNDWVAGQSVEADVIIASDGIPSAIRFVN